MKMLFTSADRIAVGLIKSALDAAGVECELRNDAMQANFPGAAFYPEIWIVDDGDYSRAEELRDGLLAPAAVNLGPWTCSGCGEGLEAQFLSCWKCGSKRDVAASPDPNSGEITPE